MSDLTLANTATFADLGTIIVPITLWICRSPGKTFYSGGNPTGALVLNEAAQTTASTLSAHLIGHMMVNIWSPELTLHLMATAKLMFTAFQERH